MWIRLAYLYILCFEKAFEIILKVFKFLDPVLSPVNHLPKPGPGPLKNTGDNRGRGPRSDVNFEPMLKNSWIIFYRKCISFLGSDMEKNITNDTKQTKP